ncbi:MAG: 4-amino-4-deoxy-L-arabinose transferase, partial [Parapedobacter sp.]
MPIRSTRTLSYFLLIWLIVNLIQSAFSELHYDETYYWVFSRFLDWGYYDHPPMVALFIKMGSLLMPGALGVRLFSVLSNVAAIFILWKIAKAYANNLSLFILLYSSMLILHVYSFITTPDTPLFFFTVLFFFYLRKYLDNDRMDYAVILGLIAAGMLYSKYHAILVFAFTVLAYWKLLKRPSFWLIAGLAVLLFLPHIIWQVSNGYPSIEYHLFDRTTLAYRFSFTTDFLLSQLLIVGPLTGIFLYYYVYRQKTPDVFLRVLKFNCFGFLLFFFLSSFKSRIEAHWTLLAFIPFFILAYLYLAQLPRLPLWLKRLFYANIA